MVLLAVAVTASVLTLVLRTTHADSVITFVVAAVALGALAGLVGEATDQLGHRLGPGATGVLQSALGNLPELFISLFALKAGLVVLVQTALIGSILANSLLVLGLAFIAGGLRNGVQRFGQGPVRLIATMLVLAVAALTIPTLATAPGAPDAGHERDLSLICAAVLLVVFACSIPFSIRGGPGASRLQTAGDERWSTRLAVAILAGAAIGAAFVSDWFIEALKPAMASLGISEEFVGLVIVAIAGNAVENVSGIRAAMRDEADLAISLILNSSLQVALAMTPVLIFASLVIGGPPLTLVVSPLLIASVGLAAFLDTVIVVDGESTWLEGVALVGLYVIIAASVWWGPRIVA